jgi:uroporphyrinogen-III synthase
MPSDSLPPVPKPPLDGVRVVVTRAEHQAHGLADALAAAGAQVERLPLLAVLPPEDPRPLQHAARSLDGYAWVAFTSANAVRALLPLLPGGWPPGVAIAAIGGATAQALADAGAPATLVASRAQAEELAAELLPHLAAGQRVLLPQAADARPALGAGLRAPGVEVDAVVAYRKTLPPEAPARAAALFGDGPLGWVTFASPSAVRSFALLLEPRWSERRRTLRAASIGPVTSEALRALGVVPAAEAKGAADAALVRAIVAVVGTRRRQGATA